MCISQNSIKILFSMILIIVSRFPHSLSIDLSRSLGNTGQSLIIRCISTILQKKYSMLFNFNCTQTKFRVNFVKTWRKITQAAEGLSPQQFGKILNFF